MEIRYKTQKKRRSNKPLDTLYSAWICIIRAILKLLVVCKSGVYWR